MLSNTKKFLVMTGLVAGVVGFALAGDEPPAASPAGATEHLVVVQGLKRAPRVAEVSHNRYRTLLATIAVPNDQTTYGDFCDFGHWDGKNYAGHDNLPEGYWVYLSPNWYIFKELDNGSPMPARGPRSWGPEQATGAPNTWPNAGDIQTAWASQTPDGQAEWLELTYDAPVRPFAVSVYETFNPGAVTRVTGYDEKGTEVELWSGSDPTPAGKDKGISVIPVHPEFDLTRVRVYIDSPKVQGWNEIDAVGLLDAAGATHWAASATASSTYADLVNNSPLEEIRLNGQIDRLDQFQDKDVERLRLRSYWQNEQNR